MSKPIEQAVNQALSNIELMQNKAFVELMAALHEKLDATEYCSQYDYVEVVHVVKSAIGEFVSP